MNDAPLPATARAPHRPPVPAPRSLGRILGLLEAIAQAPGGLTLAQLSAGLGSPKSSLLNLLRPLVDSGHLLHQGGRYELGPAAFRLAGAILARRQFSTLLRPFLTELVAQSGETAFLCVIDREAGLATYVDCIESPQMVRYTVRSGTARPLYCSAAGRLLLAYQPVAWRQGYLRRTPLVPLTPRTVTAPGRLNQILREARAQGFTVTLGEVVPDAGGIAAPVFNRDGSVDAALLVGAPLARFRRELAGLKRTVAAVAARASAALGYTGKADADTGKPHPSER